MSKHLINFIDISKSYDNNLVLDELNLYVSENEFLTLLGHPVVAKQQRFVSWVDSRHLTKEKFFLMVLILQTFRQMNAN